MKLFYLLVILVFLNQCSFDNKTGIWKNENNITNEKNMVFDQFKTFSSTTNIYNKELTANKNYKFNIPRSISNNSWSDIFYTKNNNSVNFKYNNSNKLSFKSKKISRNNINQFFLFNENKVITSDVKGNIIIFSVNENKTLKFNFYKKKYKKFNKILNIIVERNIIYVSDNLGYLYAYDYKKDKVVWAKNFKVPFRSNLKIFENTLIASNQINNLYFFDKKTGLLKKTIPTEETILKNDFKNNLSLNKNTLFFLNTYGSLYSININSYEINWFINLNQSIDINPSNLFFGSQIVNDDRYLAISSNLFTYILDIRTGTILFKKNFSIKIKPIIINNLLFSISRNNFLISIDLKSGKEIFSHNIDQLIANFLDTKKKKTDLKNIFIVNNEIFVFLQNSYILKLGINGKLKKIDKLPSKINSHPIFLENSIILINRQNKVVIID
tara:strand:- start:1406 stop:2728 length:1323 start_codon:yes stop_codon:yes gene_type:complete